MNKNLKQKPTHRGITRPRRGIYMLELILILPLILLVLTILYQVSVMMTTYQALRLTVFNAAATFAQTQATADVKTTIESSIAGYYFHKAEVKEADSSTWTTAFTPNTTPYVKYRLLYSTDSGANWQYYDAETSTLSNGNLIAVELKLENAENVYQRYWLLAKFTGVTAVKSESMVLSQITVPKLSS